MGRTPLYLSIADALRRRIEAEEWQIGDRLPAESVLASELFVSRVTLREALQLLEREGLVVRRHGVGSFVARRPAAVTAEINKLEPFALSMQRAGFPTTEDIVAIHDVTLPADVARSLSVAAGSPGRLLEMVRTIDATPIIYSRDYVLPDVIDTDEFVKVHRNILSYLSDTNRPTVEYALLGVQAVLPERRVMEVLRCDPLEPLVLLDGVAYSAERRPLYATSFYIRSRHYKLTLLRR